MDWLTRRDKHSRLSLEPLDGVSDSVILKDPDGTWTESTAILRSVEHLGGIWRMARLLRLIPAPVRNAAYRFVARRRTTAVQAAQNTGG
ncbi:MAG: DCC1-like thiol-disulfide oxidoreductase family protein [Bacteroidota bacterium]|nr:DCC1-like thiol-disulfide oxidoreductase family protein [Bacteroidota bacterium]